MTKRNELKKDFIEKLEIVGSNTIYKDAYKLIGELSKKDIASLLVEYDYALWIANKSVFNYTDELVHNLRTYWLREEAKDVSEKD